MYTVCNKKISDKITFPQADLKKKKQSCRTSVCIRDLMWFCTVTCLNVLPTSALANNGISWKGEMAWPLLSPDNKMVRVSNMGKLASDK